VDTYRAEVASKSLRRCVTTITTSGPDAVAVVLQGRLDGNTITKAGIAAQPKAPRPAVAAA
jgi:hypothetical protein